MATDFGSRVAQARKHAGFTQKQLAPLVGMSQSNLSELETIAFESGKTVQIACRCNVNACWLATGEGNMLDGVAATAPQITTLELSLKTLGEALAAVTDANVVEDLADALAKLARRRGSGRDQEMVVHLLKSKRTGTNG